MVVDHESCQGASRLDCFGRLIQIEGKVSNWWARHDKT